MRLTWKPRKELCVREPRHVYEIAVRRRFPGDQETFFVLLLGAKNQVLRGGFVPLGPLTVSLVHPKEVFRPAIMRAAASIILVHDYPWEVPTASKEDIEVTEKLAKAGRIVGIDLLDHVIVGSYGRFRSLRAMGYL